jgi:hypothetical protein
VTFDATDRFTRHDAPGLHMVWSHSFEKQHMFASEFAESVRRQSHHACVSTASLPFGYGRLHPFKPNRQSSDGVAALPNRLNVELLLFFMTHPLYRWDGPCSARLAVTSQSLRRGQAWPFSRPTRHQAMDRNSRSQTLLRARWHQRTNDHSCRAWLGSV